MDLPIFPPEAFRFVFAYKKKSRLILGNFHVTYLILYKLFQLSS